MAVELSTWLVELRRAEVVASVRGDPRSAHGSFLGLSRNDAMDAIGWGQAAFDESWQGMSPADRVLLYAYFNQLGHLEELTVAFRTIFGDREPPNNPIVADLGCGPFTGGLAFAGILGNTPRFDYIGVDTSATMREFGEHLASRTPHLNHVRRFWASDLSSLVWDQPPTWRPVLVIVSYLLASPTVDALRLAGQLDSLLARLGNGRVAVLYTNATGAHANRHYPAFSDALCADGFDIPANGFDEIIIDRVAGPRSRKFRYALFHRPPKTRLELEDR